MKRLFLTLVLLFAVAAVAAQSTAPATSASAPVSLPSLMGDSATGIYAQIYLPATIEENDFLKTKIELHVDPASLPKDTTLLDLHLFEARCELQLRDASTGKTFTVHPFDPTSGMPPLRDDKDFAADLAKPLPSLDVMFPLRTAKVPPGKYECIAIFAGKRPADSAAGYWLDKAATGKATLTIEKQSPKSFIAFAPKSLHIDPDGKLHAHANDLEKLSLPTGNGLMSGCEVRINGQTRSLSGGITGPDDPNLNGFIREDPAKTTEISVTFFVTGTAVGHFWDPASDEDNYREVWTKTYKIAAPAAAGSAPTTSPTLDPATNPSNRPNTTLIPAPQDRTMDRQFTQKHTANIARAKQGNIDLLFLGDSIMQGWTSGGDWGKTVFDKTYAQYNTAVFAIGYNRTQHLLWQLANGEGEGYTPKVIQLLVGTNNLGPNTPAETILGEKALLDDLRKRFPDARILLLAILPRGTPADPVRKDLATVNAALEKMADDKHIFFLDISQSFLKPDGTTSDALKPDRLHPSAKGYQAWADAVKPTLDKLLKDAGVTPKATTNPN